MTSPRSEKGHRPDAYRPSWHCRDSQHDDKVDALLQGVRRSLAGMPQRHLLPTEEGLEAWVLRQDWLMLDSEGVSDHGPRFRSRPWTRFW